MGSSIEKININGSEVPVIFEQNNYLPIVSMQIVFENSGELSSPIDGLVDLSAKLLNEGTQKDGSSNFATRLDEKAISLSAHATRTNFIIELDALKSEFHSGVKLLEELLSDPNYTQKALERVKRQKIGWLTQKESDYDYTSRILLTKVLFQGTPLARDSKGTKSSTLEVKIDDIKNFIDTKLGYNNAIVVIGGSISQEEAKKSIVSILGKLKKVEKINFENIKASSKREIKQEFKKDIHQAYIYFGAPLNFSYDSEDQYKAKIASHILGASGFGSRIMEEVRVKRGLAYSAYAMLVRSKLSSYLIGSLQTKVESKDEAMRVVKKVIDDFVKEGVTQQELDEAKEFLVGSEALRNETLSQRLGRAFENYYLGRPLDFEEEQLKKIENANLQEINEFIQSHNEITKLSFSIVTKGNQKK
ncbi:MAG: insulinase family protein [Campylobacterales bacterium]|nr:insulinase family protein [Campylobacterales bacterium]